MSTYAEREESAEDSCPVEAYTFAIGPNTFDYTATDASFTVGATTFLKESIARTKIVEGGSRRNNSIRVTLPRSNPFVSQYIASPPGRNATLRVFGFQHGLLDATNQALIFRGRVQNVEFMADGTGAEVTVAADDAGLVGTMPRRRFSTSCNHVLYGPGCTVDPSTHTHTGTVTAVSSDGKQVTVSGLSASGIDGTGGFARPDAVPDFRLITAQSGDVITLLLPFASDPDGLEMRVFRGCDHRIDGDCALVFDNVLNFDGFAYVPVNNPFVDDLDGNA